MRVTGESSKRLHTQSVRTTTPYPELILGYEPDGKISRGVCSLCGEDLPEPDPPFIDIRDEVSAFSEGFRQHVRTKHRAFIPN
jgi:hypothetical protein